MNIFQILIKFIDVSLIRLANILWIQQVKL